MPAFVVMAAVTPTSSLVLSNVVNYVLDVAFDSDNHYYEAEDAFTRHIPKAMSKRCVQWVEIGGRRRLLVGGRLDGFIPNPTFDPVGRPGALQEFFKGRAGTDVRAAFGELEPIRPEYRDRTARLAVMDEQGLDGAWLFPTLGVGIEEALATDGAAAMAAFTAFNQWLDDDWGYAHEGRLFGTPYLSLVDLDLAVAELEVVLGRGARVICMRPGPVHTAAGSTSPFTEDFDPFCARVAEAGITVAFHGGDSGYGAHVAAWEPATEAKAFFATPLSRAITSNRAITETMLALLCHRLLERHPRLRIASIENGASWVSHLLRLVKKSAAMTPGWFTADPVELFHRHVWVSPFWEDDAVGSVEAVGADRTLFGSDWPHTEGLADPTGYRDELAGLPGETIDRVMGANALELTAPLP
jgi:predicted TIM-barrel fold metal-dependent hydrolase